MSLALTLANASELTPSLWIGGDLDTRRPSLAHRQLDELDAAGINAIIDCRLEWDDAEWVTAAKPHFDYLWHGVDDAGQRMPDCWFDEGVEYALDRIAQGHVVLAHCHMGINRGPSMGFAIMLATGCDPIEALDRIRAARPIAFVAYAEGALDWWLRKCGAPDADRRAHRQRLSRWRAANGMDLARVIRQVRSQEVA